MAHVICPPFFMPMSHKHPSDSLRAASPPTTPVDANYFDALRERVIKFTHRPKQKAT
uniref:Uncharacterized protein n=1 Tax=Ralstonia solanacearum TaxID=305 RepID=A0A0S4WF22_RALSL|nr:conserved protein of unknown function [Ralstonia solanacearum]